ncbi:ABC transporter permease [Nonomuraea ferruginea]
MLVLLPFWTSLMVRTYAWLVLLQDTGPFKAVLAAIGLGQVDLIRNTTGVVIGMAQILLPFMVLPLYNNLQKIERSDLLAAQSMGGRRPSGPSGGCTSRRACRGCSLSSVLVFILALGFYITPVILGSPQNSMMSQLIVRQVTERLDWASGGAMAVVLAVLTLVFVGLMSRVVNVQQAFGGTVDKK